MYNAQNTRDTHQDAPDTEETRDQEEPETEEALETDSAASGAYEEDVALLFGV